MAEWRVFGERLETADMVAPFRVWQPAKMKQNVVLKAIRSWFVFQNQPVFSDLKMRVYRNVNDVVGELIAESSNSYPSPISTMPGAVAELFFEFEQGPSLEAEDTYHFVFYAAGYTGDETSHIAWVRGLPDPVYPTGITVSITKAGEMPFKLAFFGDEL